MGVSVELKKELIKEVIENIKERFNAKGYSIIFLAADLNPNIKPLKLVSIETEKMNENGINLSLSFEGKEYTNLIIGFCNKAENQNKEKKDLLRKFEEQFPSDHKANQTTSWRAFIFYKKYLNWKLPTLTNIKFDEDNHFYKDLEEKVEIMINMLKEI
jgi:hypothetical protein